MTRFVEAPQSKAFKWLEARVLADGEAVEAVSEFFNRISTGGAALEQANPTLPADAAHPPAHWVIGYFPVYTPTEEEMFRRRIEEGLWHIAQIRPLGESRFKLLADEDWAEAWKSHYHPLRVGSRFVIKPTWREWFPGADDLIIEIDPGMAFGTGLHPTTQLCLRAIEQICRPGDKVLDLGCGSGILSIAAGLMSAEQVLAVDIDPLAAEIAEENVRQNRLRDHIEVLAGTLPPRDERDAAVVARAAEIAPQGFQLILANILAEIIADLLDDGLSDWLTAEGNMVLSGIIEEREFVVLEALERAGLHISQRLTQEDWVALIVHRPLSAVLS